MANVDSPFGLRAVGVLGSDYIGPTMPCFIPSTYATALFIGDPVIFTGTSNTALVTVPGGGSFLPGTMPEINMATAAGGSYISGVISSFAANPDALQTQYSPASTEGVAYVIIDPDVLFEIQEDDAGTALAATAVGNNADLVYTHAGNTTTGLSGAELDASTINTTNTLQLRVIQFVNREDNEFGDWAKWIVRINLHSLRNLTGI